MACCWCLLGFAQLNQIAQKDSLLRIIKQGKKDSAQLSALISMADAIEDNYPDSALAYYEQSQPLLALSKTSSWQADYYKGLFNVYEQKGNYAKLYELTVEARAFANQTADLLAKAYTYGNISYIYSVLDINDEVASLAEQSMAILKQLKDSSSIMLLLSNMANACFNQEQYSQSIGYSKIVLAYASENKVQDSFLTAQALLHLHMGYSFLQELDSSSFYLSRCLRFCENYSNNRVRVHVFGTAVEWLIETKQYDSAFVLIGATRNLLKNTGNKAQLAETHRLASWAYIDQKNIVAAQKELAIANVLLAKETVPLLMQYLMVDAAFDIAAAKQDYKAAYEASQTRQLLEDSMSSVKTKAKFQLFGTRLEAATTQLQLNEKQKIIQQQQTKIKMTTVIAAALLACGLMFWLYQRQKQLARHKALLVLQKEQELNTTKASLEGQLQERSRISKEIHDELGSSMTSISLLTEVLRKKMNEEIVPEVNKISNASADVVDKMNEIIWALNTSNDSLGSLVAYIRKFCRQFLQDANIQLVFNETVQSTDHVLEGSIRRNLYLTVKESLNNVVKHAKASKVVVGVMEQNHNLVITIQDDGVGIGAASISEFGNGLHNMKKRMEEIGGQFEIANKTGTQTTLAYRLRPQTASL
jgi:signal transduction histidine kinase